MSFESTQFRYGNDVAAADLSAKQYHFVTMTSAGWDLVGAGARIDGVLQDKVNIGKACEVAVLGVTKVVLGGTVTKGQEVESDANSKAIVLAAGKSAGVVLESGVAGDIVALHYYN